MQNFVDALMEAKRRARLRGESITPQETSAIAEGYAGSARDKALQEYQIKSQEKQFAEQLAAQKEQFGQTLGMKERELMQQQSQWAGTLSAQKSQFQAQLGNTKEQFGREMALKEAAFEQERQTSAAQLQQAKDTLAEQIRQFNASSQAQKDQFGAQMQFQIDQQAAKVQEWEKEFARREYEFGETLKLQREQYEAQLAAAQAAQDDDGGTWICTETTRTVGMSKEERKAMRKLRKYAKKEHPEWLTAYRYGGPALVKAIAATANDIKAFYAEIRKALVDPVVEKVKKGNLEGAYQHYKETTIGIAADHAPGLMGTLAEA